MDSLIYSTDALNVIDDLYEVSTIIYVEGSDDVIFWRKIFKRFYSKTFEVIDLGGKPELIKIAESLREDEDLEYIVAFDLDYSIFNNELPSHPNIVTTFGHSIENTLIQKKAIFTLAENCGLTNESFLNTEFDILYSSIKVIVDELLSLDVYNYNNDKKSVIGKNIQKFSKKGKVYRIKKQDLSLYVSSSLDMDFDKSIRATYDSSRLTVMDVINGHFLFSILLKFLDLNSKSFRSSLDLSNDALLMNLLSVFDGFFSEDHPHYNFYLEKIGSLNITAPV